jgi:hypothetical protein
MTQLLKLLKAHKGKTTSATLALAAVLWLLARGCDIQIHIDPASARTNDPPAGLTNAP